MKSFPTALVLAAGAAAMTPNTQSLDQSLTRRQDFCGIDQFGNGWSCETAGTLCCIGTWQGVCMPVGYKCCTTGLYCGPDEECVIDTDNDVQYCVELSSSGSSGNKATHTADAGQASRTGASRPDGSRPDSSSSSGSSSSSSSDKEKSDDKDDKKNAAVSLVSSKTLALIPLLGAAVAWL